MLFLHAPGRADAVVAQFRGFVCGVPALKDHFKLLRRVRCCICLKPLRFYQSAAQWRWRLEVLRGKIVFAQGFAKMIEYLEWLSIWMKSFASAALKTARSIWCLDVVTLIFLGNRGESNHLPGFH